MQIIEEKYTWRGNLGTRPKTDYIVLHHAAARTCTAQDIHKWHLASGWAGIGYHFFVRKNGAIYRGRPLSAPGAHVYGYNHLSLGICAEGDYQKDYMPLVQKQALAALVSFTQGIYPTAKIVGHGDLTATACPGKNYPLGEMRNMADEVKVQVKGREIAGRMINGATWVPLRALVEALAYQIDWDEIAKIAKVE